MESLVTFVEIMFINMLLSGDNAVVIALASQQLPHEQRRKAILWGAALAVALRCMLTLVAISLLKVPYLQAGGAVLLFLIAIKLIADAAGGSQQSHDVRKAKTLGQAVRTIIAADFIMSLDNVLAIAAIADGEPVLILLGIAVSIPMIIWGSQLLSRMLQKFPPLVYIGGGLLGYAAGEMLAHDPGILKLLMHHAGLFQEAVPILSVPFVIAAALLRLRR